MVIRTEYRSQGYSMGSSDPLPAGFEIRFGSLNFQATGNGYLMRLTNRDELHARRQTGSLPIPAALVATTPTPTSTDAAGPSAPRRRRRSGQCSQQVRAERRHAARITSQRDAPTGETTAAPTGERSVSGLRFPIGLRGATTAYVTSANTDVATRRVRPGRHVPATRDPSASADDESSHGSASELPPATSHGYAEWDFSGVPDPVMFRRFLDATDYWFGYSDDSSAGSYDPARECCVVITIDQENVVNVAEARDGEVPPARELDHARVRGQAPLPSHHRGGPTSTRSWLKCASINVDDTPPRASQKLVAAATLLRAMPAPHRPSRGTCTARRKRSSSRRPFSRPKARFPASASRGARGSIGTHGWRGGASRPPRAHATQGANP
jgi:hypothetical protein